MLFPNADKLNEYRSRYELVLLAAKRAKQLNEKAPKLIETTSDHPLTIALEEIAAGKIRPVYKEPQAIVEEFQDEMAPVALLPGDLLEPSSLSERVVSSIESLADDSAAVADASAKSAVAKSSSVTLAELIEKEENQAAEAPTPPSQSIADLLSVDDSSDEIALEVENEEPPSLESIVDETSLMDDDMVVEADATGFDAVPEDSVAGE